MKKVLITNTLVKFLEGDLSPLPFSDVWVNVASSAEEMLDIHILLYSSIVDNHFLLS